MKVLKKVLALALMSVYALTLQSAQEVASQQEDTELAEAIAQSLRLQADKKRQDKKELFGVLLESLEFQRASLMPLLQELQSLQLAQKERDEIIDVDNYINELDKLLYYWPDTKNTIKNKIKNIIYLYTQHNLDEMSDLEKPILNWVIANISEQEREEMVAAIDEAIKNETTLKDIVANLQALQNPQSSEDDKKQASDDLDLKRLQLEEFINEAQADNNLARVRYLQTLLDPQHYIKSDEDLEAEKLGQLFAITELKNEIQNKIVSNLDTLLEIGPAGEKEKEWRTTYQQYLNILEQLREITRAHGDKSELKSLLKKYQQFLDSIESF